MPRFAAPYIVFILYHIIPRSSIPDFRKDPESGAAKAGGRAAGAFLP